MSNPVNRKDVERALQRLCVDDFKGAEKYLCRALGLVEVEPSRRVSYTEKNPIFALKLRQVMNRLAKDGWKFTDGFIIGSATDPIIQIKKNRKP